MQATLVGSIAASIQELHVEAEFTSDLVEISEDLAHNILVVQDPVDDLGLPPETIEALKIRRGTSTEIDSVRLRNLLSFRKLLRFSIETLIGLSAGSVSPVIGAVWALKIWLDLVQMARRELSELEALIVWTFYARSGMDRVIEIDDLLVDVNLERGEFNLHEITRSELAKTLRTLEGSGCVAYVDSGKIGWRLRERVEIVLPIG